MQRNLNRLFAQAMLGYRQGKMLPMTMSQAASGALYSTCAQRLIQERLSAEAHEQFLTVRDLSRQAVVHAKQTQYAEARQAFGQAAAYLREHVAAEEVRWLGHSWLGQGEAYLAVRLQQWEHARARLQAAMAAETLLEETYGYTLFHVSRVHLVHLLLRVEASAGQAALAVELAQHVVSYLLGYCDTLPWGHGWSAARAAQIPTAFRHGLLARIASEVGTVLALQLCAEARALFQSFPSWQQFADQVPLAEIYHWGQTKAAFLHGNTVAFLEHCTDFLAAGRRETTLWYATVLDLCHCCAALRPALTRAFRQEVAADATQWQGLPDPVLPAALRTRLARQDVSVPAGPSYIHRPPPRQFQAYNVGLPKTGTSSIWTLFGHYRSGNEFMERETVIQIVKRYDGSLSDTAFRAYLLRRDQEGGLEMDAASFNHFYLDLLVEMFPQAKFIFTIREPYTWMNSYCKMLLRYRRLFATQGVPPPQWMTDYGRILFGTFSWDAFTSLDVFQSQLATLVDGFVRHWGEANRRIFALLPRDRALVLRTYEISTQLDALAQFVGVPRRTLTAIDRRNVNPDHSNVLQDLEPTFFQERCALYASDILQQAGFSTAVMGDSP
jgi:hypothetical protein